MKQIEICTNEDPWELQSLVNVFLEEHDSCSVTVTAIPTVRDILFMAVIDYMD
jgi:hypothetical protein